MIDAARQVVGDAAGLLAVAAFATFQLPAFGGHPDGVSLARMPASPQFICGRFENTPPQHTDSSILTNLRLYRQGFVRTPTFPIPVVPAEVEGVRITCTPSRHCFAPPVVPDNRQRRTAAVCPAAAVPRVSWALSAPASATCASCR